MCILEGTAVASFLSPLLGSGAVGAATAAAGTSAISTGGVIAGTLNTLAGISALGGIASGIAGNIQQANAARAEAEYQANIERQNARIAQENAKKERQAGLEDARRQRMKTLQAIGEQKVAIAANGAEIGSGTAIDMIEDTATLGELDALNIQYNAEQRALNYEQQANNYINQANLDTIKGQNAYKAGRINALSSGLNGLSSTISTLAGGGFGSGFGAKKERIYTVNAFNKKYKNTYAIGDSAFV